MKEKNKNNEAIKIEYDAKLNKENIDYAFQKLITNLTLASRFNAYQKAWKEFENILDLVSKWAINYDETKNLKNIDLKEMQEVEEKLYDLDGEFLSSEGLYAENAYIWMGQIQVLIKKAKGIF